MTRKAGPLAEPPKLVELEHPYAELLARGNREYLTKPEETERFCRTRAGERPDARRATPAFASVALAAVALLALGAAIAWPKQRVAQQGVEVSAEPLPLPERAVPGSRVIAPPAAKRTPIAPDETPAPAPEVPRGHDRERVTARESVRDEPSQSPRTPASAAEPPATPLVEAPAPDCRELARSGKPAQAEACYLVRSQGAGLDAETALLEVARLRRDVLADPSGALAALERYRAHFPNGALKREADVAHVGMLTRLGKPEQALAETQTLLDSANGRERAFELHLLRGNIYKKSLGNAALAAREYEAAERLPEANPEASYLLGTTLEELGDAKGAAAAYRRYLARAPGGKRAADVQRRLGRL